MAPARENEIYKKKIFRCTILHTAIIAGNVVVGPAIKNANTAPGFIPNDKSPPTKGSAVILLVYIGTPVIAAINTENVPFPPGSFVIKSPGM